MSELASLLGIRRVMPLIASEAPEEAFLRGLEQGRLDGALALEMAEAAHRDAREEDAHGFAAALAEVERGLAEALLPLLRDALERLIVCPALAESALERAAQSLAESMPLAVLHAHPSRIVLLKHVLGPEREIIADAGLPTDMVEARIDRKALLASVGLRLESLMSGLEQGR